MKWLRYLLPLILIGAALWWYDRHAHDQRPPRVNHKTFVSPKPAPTSISSQASLPSIHDCPDWRLTVWWLRNHLSPYPVEALHRFHDWQAQYPQCLPSPMAEAIAHWESQWISTRQNAPKNLWQSWLHWVSPQSALLDPNALSTFDDLLIHTEISCA